MLRIGVEIFGLLIKGFILVGLVGGRNAQHSILRLDILGAVEVQRLVGVCK